jgi:putative DNA methylase
MSDATSKLIARWFPCAAVDAAIGSPEGSGRSEQAIFTWFAARPVAQARAAVLTALLPDDETLREKVEAAVRGDRTTLADLAGRIREDYPSGRPVVLDVFSGRGMIPLEAARLGLTAAGLDHSPVAALASRLLADYPLRHWGGEPPLPFPQRRGEALVPDAAPPRLVDDVQDLLAEVGERVARALALYYPRNPDGTLPWGYLWAITIPCDGCSRRFPLIGSFALRHPYRRTDDQGQSFRLVIDGDQWRTEVLTGIPAQAPTLVSSVGRSGKSARCPFCQRMHTLDTIKVKGMAGQYQDALLLAADTEGNTKKVFRTPREEEFDSVQRVRLDGLDPFGSLTAVPDELIPPGNNDTVRACGYGYRTYGELMNDRQTLQFAETVRAIRACHKEMLAAGLSLDYAAALSSYAAANLVRKLRRSTRGARMLLHGDSEGRSQNRVQVGDVFADESKISFGFDYIEAGTGEGPGTWKSVTETGLQVLAKHLRHLTGKPARFRQGSAMALPFRDASVDAVITDPPYHNMIDYLDASDLFYVWLKRALFDIVPDLFDATGLQDNREEIIVKRGNAPGEHRTKAFYQASLAKAFQEAKRVLRPDGTLVVVFGHSDPEAWKLLLLALKEAGFIVTSTWPSRTESANTGVASIKVTVTIGCRVAPLSRPVATAVQVEREVVDLVKQRVRDWERWGLALTDQLMAACGPAMEVYGRYSRIIQPDNCEAPIDRYLALARVAVRDAMTMKVDSIPLETFDTITRFAVFWMRLYGRENVNKGEALFLAEADHLRLSEIRKGLLSESRAGYKLTLEPPTKITPLSPVFDVARAMAASWPTGGVDSVVEVIVAGQRTANDEHLWAVVGELTRLLPQSDRDAKALIAIQRNRGTIEKLARAVGNAAKERPEQLALLRADEA